MALKFQLKLVNGLAFLLKKGLEVFHFLLRRYGHSTYHKNLANYAIFRKSDLLKQKSPFLKNPLPYRPKILAIFSLMHILIMVKVSKT